MFKSKHVIPLVITAVILSGCATAPKSKEARNNLQSDVDEAIAVFKQKDPKIAQYFNDAYGYAVFPKVYKGAIVLGGANGKGLVYEQDTMIGYSRLSQATIGFSLGAESFREVIFFRDEDVFNEFISEEYTFSAQVTGVALKAGAAAKANYQDGKIVFVIVESGLMVDASLGGQKFKYTPKELVEK